MVDKKDRRFSFRAAVIYFALLALGGIAFFMLTVFWVPIAEDMFMAYNIALPIPTKIAVFISDFVKSYLLFWVFAIAGIAGYSALCGRLYGIGRRVPAACLGLTGFTLELAACGFILLALRMAEAGLP